MSAHRPRLCVTVGEPTVAKLQERRDEAVRLGADLVELRLDKLDRPGLDAVAGALADRPGTPLVLTCRWKQEGGSFGGSEQERKAILAEALRLIPQGDYADVEDAAGFTDLVAENHERIVVSNHDFDGVPSDVEDRVRHMRQTGAAIVKIAAHTHALADTLKLRDAARGAGDTVVIGMGPSGTATRILAGRFGSCWSYAGDGHAPGQMSAGEMLGRYRFREIDDHTEIYGVVGKPVGHSASPAMHNAVFQAFNRNAVYVPLEAESAQDFLGFANALKLKGASVTIPYKVDFFESVEEPGKDITLTIGAINTLKRESDGWHGRNTDFAGFNSSIRTHGILSSSDLRVAVLGAGGSARAVVYALRQYGLPVTVHARNALQAQELAGRFPGTMASSLDVPAGSWDLLVNTTPVGMDPNVGETPFPLARFDGKYVYDLVYNPMETRLMREAKAAGCQVIGGLDMLVAQALHQWGWWTDVSSSDRTHEWNAAFDIMKQAAMEKLGVTEEETVR